MAINLQKGQKVNLKKNTNTGLGEIHVNLNWNSTPIKKSIFSNLFGGQGIDLDLGCLFELKDGRLGAVQARGNTFIYEGVANWQQADATVTIKCPGQEDLIVKMDTYNSTNRMCGLALLENVNDETFSVEKIVQFYPGHSELDQAFHWGIRWTPGRK